MSKHRKDTFRRYQEKRTALKEQIYDYQHSKGKYERNRQDLIQLLEKTDFSSLAPISIREMTFGNINF